MQGWDIRESKKESYTTCLDLFISLSQLWQLNSQLNPTDKKKGGKADVTIIRKRSSSSCGIVQIILTVNSTSDLAILFLVNIICCLGLKIYSAGNNHWLGQWLHAQSRSHWKLKTYYAFIQTNVLKTQMISHYVLLTSSHWFLNASVSFWLKHPSNFGTFSSSLWRSSTVLISWSIFSCFSLSSVWTASCWKMQNVWQLITTRGSNAAHTAEKDRMLLHCTQQKSSN